MFARVLLLLFRLAMDLVCLLIHLVSRRRAVVQAIRELRQANLESQADLEVEKVLRLGKNSDDKAYR